MLGPKDFSVGVNPANAIFNTTKIFYFDEIGFVQKNYIGKSDLFFSLMMFAELLVQMHGVGNRYYRVKPGAVGDILIDEKVCATGADQLGQWSQQLWRRIYQHVSSIRRECE